MDNTPQRYKQAEIRRQRILDHLAAEGPKGAIEMAAYLDEPLNTVKSTLRSMIALKEVESNGGARGKMKYLPRVTVTLAAETQYRSTRVESGSSKFAKANALNRRRKPRTGVITHRAGDLKAPSQGGQGCLRTYGRRINQDTM